MGGGQFVFEKKNGSLEIARNSRDGLEEAEVWQPAIHSRVSRLRI